MSRAPDRWADWLMHGRQRGMDRARIAQLNRGLRHIRTRVLANARLRAGQQVLDIGAGTGLLSIEARHRVRSSGRVVALDISRDALVECWRLATTERSVAPLHPIVGDAVRLPFADGAFDRVLTRSVLIYLADQPGAVRELYRVLRRGGRASLFEPINGAIEAYIENLGSPMAALQPTHDRIRAHMRANWEHEQTMMGFDERDLLRWFVEAGFSKVRLMYWFEHDADNRRRRKATLAALQARPNPSMMSYEEAARAVLGGTADEYLAEFIRLSRAHPRARPSAVAYVSATR